MQWLSSLVSLVLIATGYQTIVCVTGTLSFYFRSCVSYTPTKKKDEKEDEWHMLRRVWGGREKFETGWPLLECGHIFGFITYPGVYTAPILEGYN